MGIFKLGGIASGLDTDNLIKALMAVERKPVTLLEQKRDKLTTEQNAWRDLNSRLLNLKSRLDDLKKLDSATWKANKATIADQTVLTATADSTAVEGTHNVEVLSLAKAATWKSLNGVADANADLGQAGKIQVVVPSGGTGNGELIDIVATDSLNEIAAKINKDSSRLGLTASVLQVGAGDYRLVVTGKTGAAQDFNLADNVGTVAGTFLNINDPVNSRVETAVDGQIKVNNIAVTVTGSSTSAVPGLKMNLLKTGTTTVTVSKDTQKAVDAVKGFVDQYNSVVDFMNTQTGYDPKTKKAGTLFGKGMVNSIESMLSRRIQDEVSSLADGVNSLANLGISMEKFTSGGSVSGKLAFDQTKLLEKLKTDPDAVQKIFNLDDGVNQGVAVRTAAWLEQYTKTKGFVPNQVSMIDGQLADIKERITEYDEVILPQREQRLRAQFTALEKAMTLFNNQGSWLSAQLSGLSPQNK